jgi:hypothetical protein
MTDMTDKSLFIEEIIINSLKSLLAGRVNELLRETEYPIPPIECGSYRGGSVVVRACNPEFRYFPKKEGLNIYFYYDINFLGSSNFL